MERLRWIDDRLQWNGGFRRQELMESFGISPQQASGDIATYQSIAPGNASIIPATKAYHRKVGFAAVFPKDVHEWLLGQASQNVFRRATLTS